MYSFNNIIKNKEKMNILKQIQDNSNKLLKEYGAAHTGSSQNATEIKRLEDELVQLKDKVDNKIKPFFLFKVF